MGEQWDVARRETDRFMSMVSANARTIQGGILEMGHFNDTTVIQRPE